MTDRPPYPGLRSFRRDETDLFFGREDNIDEVIDRLAVSRFVAVLGASGSGKSSLVRTGVLEGLELGLLKTGSDMSSVIWQVADFRPGDRPLANLARALIVSSRPDAVDSAEVESLAAFLRRGPRSIIEWCRAGHLKDGANLLLLADQFEELFNYQSYTGQEQAQAFVNLLIESAYQSGVPAGDRLPIYVVMTMRSEYLGACALIEGLAEAINHGQYLTPRLSREQCRVAIEEPAAVEGVEVEPALVNHLLNDLAAFAPWDDGDTPASDAAAGSTRGRVDHLERLARRADQLPLLQHVLNRLWTKSRERRDHPITLRHEEYNASGGLRGMLSAHADEVLNELITAHGPKMAAITETVFRALVSGASVAAAVRRPTSVGTLVELARDRTGVLAVLEAYRAPGCNFLTAAAEELHDDVMIDISHESLIRQWSKLRGWVEIEAASAAWWRDIADQAQDWHREATKIAGQARLTATGLWHRLAERSRVNEMLLRDSALSQALQLRKLYSPTPSWANQYGGGYEEFDKFLSRSESASRHRRIFARTIAGSAFVIGGAMFALVLAWLHEGEGRRTADTDLNRVRLRAILTEIAAHQSAEQEDKAGALLAALYGPIVKGATPDLKLPLTDKDIQDRIRRTLEDQYLAMRRSDSAHLKQLERGTSPADPQRADSRSEVLQRQPRYFYPYLGPDNPGVIAIIVDNSIRIHASNTAGVWGEAKSIGLANMMGVRSIDRTDEIVLTLFDGGSGLVVVRDDVVYFGKIADIEKSKAQSARIEQRQEDYRASRQQEKGAPTPKGATFTHLYGCNRNQPNFLAFDDSGEAFWLVTVEGDRAYARKLFEGEQRWLLSVEPVSGRYALLFRNQIHVGRCDTAAGSEPKPIYDISEKLTDIEFTTSNALTVIDQAGLVRFIEIDPENRRSRVDVASIPSGRKYAQTSANRRLWLSSEDGKALILWNAAKQADEGIVQINNTDGTSAVGLSNWVATSTRDGRLVVRRPVATSTRSSAELAKIVIAAGGSDVSSGTAGTISDTHKLLEKYDTAIDKPQIPATLAAAGGAGPRIDCMSALDRLTDVIERRRGIERERQTQKLARDIKENCKAIPRANQEEWELLTWLSDRIMDNPTFRPAELRQQVAPLAARDNPFGLRLLASTFEEKPDVAKALNLAAVKAIDSQIPYSVIESARLGGDNPIDADRNPKPLTYAEPRYQELVGLRLQKSGQHREAVRRFVAAQQYYLQSGDGESASTAGKNRLTSAKQLPDVMLILLWQSLSSPPSQPSKNEGEQARPAGVPIPPRRPLHEDLATIAVKHSPLIRGELLLAAIEAAPDNEAKKALLSATAAAIDEARRAKLNDNSMLSLRVARGLAFQGMQDQAAAVIAHHLVDVGARERPRALSDVNARERSGYSPQLQTTIEALKLAERTNAARIPAVRNQLSEMSWNFINYTWANTRSADLLIAANALQESLRQNGARSRELTLAAARTNFWLGVLDNKPERFDRAVELFEGLDDSDPEIRLQFADAIRVQTAAMALDEPEVSAKQALAAVATRERARQLYESLLTQIGDRRGKDYVLTATVAGLSSSLQNLGNAHAVATAKLLAEKKPEQAQREAVKTLRVVYAQSALFDPERYKNLKAGNPFTRTLCCLEPESQGEDAWVVGLISGAQSLAKASTGSDSQPIGTCEKLATHPYDPRRRVEGNHPGAEAIDACLRDGSGLAGEDATRNAYLLGRAYSYADNARNETLTQFALAAQRGYPQAFYNLFYELNLASTSCSLAPALLDRYRYLVMREFLEPALQVLEPHFEPGDRDMVENLRDLAQSQPETTKVLPKIGRPLTLDFLKSKCE